MCVPFLIEIFLHISAINMKNSDENVIFFQIFERYSKNLTKNTQNMSKTERDPRHSLIYWPPHYSADSMQNIKRMVWNGFFHTVCHMLEKWGNTPWMWRFSIKFFLPIDFWNDTQNCCTNFHVMGNNSQKYNSVPIMRPKIAQNDIQQKNRCFKNFI